MQLGRLCRELRWMGNFWKDSMVGRLALWLECHKEKVERWEVVQETITGRLSIKVVLKDGQHDVGSLRGCRASGWV